MNTAELLRKKRFGGTLSTDEIAFFVKGVVNSTVNEAQAAAFLMAACINGMSPSEIGALTLSMAKNGDSFNFRSLHKKCIDKHSTGGVGDKLSLLIVPLVAECGIAVPMMSGRGLGHTGGTVDKLSSVPDFRMSFTNSELTQLLSQNNCFMIQQTESVAPADRILYQLRDITGTVESVGLITASILSKKLVEDLDGLVLDMKVGNGAFMQTFDDAKELAESMMLVAKEVGLGMTILFTTMNQPLGKTIGNWLEMQEAEACLESYETTPNDIRLLTQELSARMLMLAEETLLIEDARNKVESVWKSGAAHKRFHAMIGSQNGNWSKAKELYSGTNTVTLCAKQSGFVNHFETRSMGLQAIEIKAGRKIQSDTIEYESGMIIHKKLGDAVQTGEPLVTVYGRKELLSEVILSEISSAIHISQIQPQPEKLILDVWES